MFTVPQTELAIASFAPGVAAVAAVLQAKGAAQSTLCRSHECATEEWSTYGVA